MFGVEFLSLYKEGDTVTEIQEEVIKIMEIMIKKFNKGEKISAKQILILNRLKKTIRSIPDDDLIMALMDVDKRIRKILFEED